MAMTFVTIANIVNADVWTVMFPNVPPLMNTVRIPSIKYFIGFIVVMQIAQSGMELTGVNSPLSRIMHTMTNHMTNIACCIARL